jgi:hypothetical protein
MKLPSFLFPVLCFWRELIRVTASLNQLTTTTRAGLTNGMFNSLLIVDGQGQAIKIKDAHKLHGIGLFWGYNIFLNQRIRVELEPSGEPFSISVDEVRGLVLKSFHTRHGWATRGDFEELEANVQKAASIPEIIRLIGE